jgi:hypothetical protein
MMDIEADLKTLVPDHKQICLEEVGQLGHQFSRVLPTATKAQSESRKSESVRRVDFIQRGRHC